MTKNDFKYSAISLLLINIWTLYGFFDYYTDTGMFKGLTLLFFFGYSIYFAIGMGIILLFSRIIYFKKDKKNKIINNFFYVFAGIFNLNLFIIWSVAIILEILRIDDGRIFFPIPNLLFSIVIFIDIYKFRKIKQID
jgi:hypothetical protein